MTRVLDTATHYVALLLIMGAVAGPLCAEEGTGTNPRFARIVLFVPNGSEMPPACEDKLRNIAARTESFFAAGMEQWGHKVERSGIFARDPDGRIKVAVVRGEILDGVAAHSAPLVIMKAALEKAMEELDEGSAEGSAWWVFYHCPDHDVRGFRGMGGRNGGRAVNAYPAADGDVTPTIEIAAKEMWPLNLKGCIHEFGHALGLPHIGPKPSLQLGNTLMGPINKVFAARLPAGKEEPRVYLSEASAAMLARHPLFASRAPAEGEELPGIKVPNLTFDETPEGTLTVKGIAAGEAKAHSVVILDSQRGFGDYWARSYCAAVNGEGEFSVRIDEPFDGQRGKLALFFCLQDGRNTGTGQREALQRDFIEIQYEGRAGARTFTRQAKPSPPRRRGKRPARPGAGGPR